MGIKRALKQQQRTRPHKFKPITIPDGFVLIQDTREQLPPFTRIKGLTIFIDTLHNRDYTIRGFEDKFGIERKQESDFFTYIGKERDRTIRKLKVLSGFEWAALVLEGMNYDDLLVQNFYSQLTPEHVRGFLTSLNVRYGIHFFAHRKREVCERWILDRAVKFYKMKREI
jgi:ERCC4-type nuclease